MLGSFFPIVFVYFASAGISQLEISSTGFQFNNFNANIAGYTMAEVMTGGVVAIAVHFMLIV